MGVWLMLVMLHYELLVIWTALWIPEHNDHVLNSRLVYSIPAMTTAERTKRQCEKGLGFKT
jgi:hypothetical protein